uniref:Uncharacterized protein n=1 Tax=Globodera rostochiensis TaxID=31243 RepID=A0A914IDT1_GLORO
MPLCVQSSYITCFKGFPPKILPAFDQIPKNPRLFSREQNIQLQKMIKKPSILTENKDILDKVKLRTKFEVAHAVWNPRINLIALGSRDGDVVVKRYLWKTGWKRNFSREDLAKQFDVCIGTLEASSSNFSEWMKLPYSPSCVEWLKFRPKMSLNFPHIGQLSATAVQVSSDKFNFNENAPKNHRNVCGAVEHFYRDIFHKSLSATFLCVMHSMGADTFVDIFSCGILLIRRFNVGDWHSSNPLNEIFLSDGKFHILSKGSDSFAILKLPEQVGHDHLLVFDQISDCICWMSFCCVYLQKMFHYSVHNWKQSSISSTNICNRCQLWRSWAVIEKFLGASTTQKELKQAGNFADEYTVLIKGIVNGLQPATETLRNSIGLLRSLLVKLNELSDSRENGGLSERLLETLLKIAAGHPKFEAHENLGKNCEQILKDFEHSILSLESKLLDVLKLAELNKKELGHLVRWFIALIYESGNDCGMEIDENIDVKLIGNLLSSITQKCGHETIGECVLDRVMGHLFSDCEMGTFPSDSSIEGNGGRNGCGFENSCARGMSEEDKTSNGAKCAHWTLWGQIQKCLQHFQTLSDDGINSLVRPASNRSKCIALSTEEGEAAFRLIDFETNCEEEEEEIDGREGMSEGEEGVGCKESVKKSISLHSFIFGHSAEERMECG